MILKDGGRGDVEQVVQLYGTSQSEVIQKFKVVTLLLYSSLQIDQLTATAAHTPYTSRFLARSVIVSNPVTSENMITHLCFGSLAKREVSSATHARSRKNVNGCPKSPIPTLLDGRF